MGFETAYTSCYVTAEDLGNYRQAFKVWLLDICSSCFSFR